METTDAPTTRRPAPGTAAGWTGAAHARRCYAHQSAHRDLERAHRAGYHRGAVHHLLRDQCRALAARAADRDSRHASAVDDRPGPWIAGPGWFTEHGASQRACTG